MKEARLQIPEGMQRRLRYRKFSGITRMLILETSYFFDKSWLRAAESLGWRTATVPSAMIGGLTREDIARLFETIGAFRPHFILTSNYAGMDEEGMFARFFEDAKIPYVSWFTDTPRMILFGRKMYVSEYSVAATWEKHYVPYFERLGFQHIHYMPLATDPALFQGAPAEEFERPLAFVGSSMIQQSAEALEKHQHLPHILAAVAEAFEEDRVTREKFAEGIDAVIDEALLAPLNDSERRNLELLLNYEATRRQRAALAQRLAPLGLEVRGDALWQGILTRVGGNVGYFQDLAPFYRGTAINVNSTSLQMRSAVNQRVFDCPSAGGFLITDAQGDLFEHFDAEQEMATYNSLDELEDKVRYYAQKPGERTAMIRRAQARVAAHHTHANRLNALEAFLKERFS